MKIKKIKYNNYKKRIKKMLNADFIDKNNIEDSDLVFHMEKYHISLQSSSWGEIDKSLILKNEELKELYDELLHIDYEIENDIIKIKNNTPSYILPLKITYNEKFGKIYFKWYEQKRKIEIDSREYSFSLIKINENKYGFFLTYLMNKKLNKNFHNEVREMLDKILMEKRGKKDRNIYITNFSRLFKETYILKIDGDVIQDIDYVLRKILDCLLMESKTYIELEDFKDLIENPTTIFDKNKHKNKGIIDKKVRRYYLRSFDSNSRPEFDMVFMSYYNVLEYFMDNSRKAIKESFNILDKVLYKLRLKKLTEINYLENILTNFLDYEEYRNVNKDNYQNLGVRKLSFCKGAPIIDWNLDKSYIIKVLAIRIYQIRCSIVHSKEFKGSYDIFNKNHYTELEKEIPLIKGIAENIIRNKYQVIKL